MTTSDCYRRDPQKGENGIPAQRGFTVIELMITIGVIAIIASLALPSYRTLIEKRQVTSGAQQISAFLSSAKVEAIKRNEQIAIWRDLENQCIGYFSLATDADRSDCDCTLLDPDAVNACAVDELRDGSRMALRVISSSILTKPVDITAFDLGGGDDLVIFDPVRGMLVADDTVEMPLQVKMVSDDQTYALNVRLSATGRTTICTDVDAELAVPGYDVCEVFE